MMITDFYQFLVDHHLKIFEFLNFKNGKEEIKILN